jgi:site-specific DNA-methyltransferase (adenine-specific)
MQTNSVYLGDCLGLMQHIPSGSIDMILCDLPYGTTACKWDTIIPFEPLWEQYERIIKQNGAIVLTASQPFTTDLINSNRDWFKYEWIWQKTMPTGMGNSSFMPMKYHENILVFYKSKPTYNPQMEKRSDAGIDRLKNSGKIKQGSKKGEHFSATKHTGTYFKYDKTKVLPKSVQLFGSVPNCNGTKLHPTQKPTELFEYLIKTYTNEGELVLDNCAGSGTTAIACLNTNRKYILMEKEKHYYDIINKRILDHTSLFTEAHK